MHILPILNNSVEYRQNMHFLDTFNYCLGRIAMLACTPISMKAMKTYLFPRDKFQVYIEDWAGH